MKSKTRRTILLIIIMIICVGVILIYDLNEEIQYQDAYYAYIERGYEETKVNNLVSAIYLNYRVFDTLFEALLLAISVTAVVYFAAPWEIKKEEEDE